jgi:hypothetical protein
MVKKTSGINDIDLNKWKHYEDIITEVYGF